jgi:alpha-D-ribose 1-methylphosphonate 5-triphosphate synthase subunit PhnH
VTAVVSNPVFQNQAAFRAVMDAFASPGGVKTLPDTAAPPPLAPASAAIIRSLADFETPIWLDPALSILSVVDWLRFHTGAPIVSDKRAASFALIGDAKCLPEFSGFSIGSADYPDRSATILLQVSSLREGDAMTLRGPGIEGARQLRAGPLPTGVLKLWSENRETFPCGIDLILITGAEIAALPRSVRIGKGD